MPLYSRSSKEVMTKKFLSTSVKEKYGHLEDNNPYVLNSENFRSDEFIENHGDKLHVLFSGCSQTFGEGLPLELTWSKIVYNKINENNICSGYFNIAENGANNFQIISDVYKYILKYGKPDVIIINFTEIFRGYNSYQNELYIEQFDPSIKNFKTNNKNKYFNKSKNKIEINALLNHFYEYYLMLEQYCNALSIKLITFSWALYEDCDKENLHPLADVELNKKAVEVLKQFESFIVTSRKEYSDFLKEKVSDLQKVGLVANNIPNFFNASDDGHSGYIENKYWSNKVLEKWKDIII